MSTRWFKTMAAAAMTALTFGFAPKAEAVSYRYPVYNDPSDPAKGIKEWKEGDREATEVSTTAWGTAGTTKWYVVSSSKTFSGRITCRGDVHLILADGVTLTANAGIMASPDVDGYSSFTIYAQSEGASMGKLVATPSGYYGSAAIGGADYGYSGSNITINGGEVTATGNGGGAGIGGGYNGDGSYITINGGTVTVAGNGGGAGIGGYNGDGSYITINGGTVKAKGQGAASGLCAAGIGGGASSTKFKGNGSYITINGGTVETKPGGTNSTAACIGGGNKGGGSYITINGGTVVATGNGMASAIGAGVDVYTTVTDIYVSTTLLLKADNDNPPTTVIPNDGGDLATALIGQSKATIVPTYAITLDLGIEHGNVAADATRTNESATVTLTLTPNEGYAYEDGSLTITKDGGGTVDPTEVTAGEKYTFVMPGTNVTVTATFAAQSQTITTVGTMGGTVDTSPSGSAKTDETVVIMVNPESGYELTDLKVYKTGEPSTEVAVWDSMFTMPPYGVTVSATFAAVPVVVQPQPKEHTTVGGVYTNSVAVEEVGGKYIVASGATVDVVFQGNTGYFFLTDGTYTPIATNTVTATSDPTPVAGPAAVAGTKCGTSVWGFKDNVSGALTLVGTGATASGSKNNPFRGDSLTSVVIQPGVTEIGQFFFKNCTHLNSVTGGKDLATVGNQAFFGCMSLETITLDGNMPAGMDNAVVYKTAIKPSGETYDIPDIKVKNYVKALFGAKDAKNPEWVNLGSPENQSIYASEYSFFHIRLVPVE